MKKIQVITMITFLTFAGALASSGRTIEKEIKSIDMDTLELTKEWDKTFPQSDKVEHVKIIFHNRYGRSRCRDVMPRHLPSTVF